jgi:uncharacterized membrane protein (UPF0182 family)
VEPLYLLAETSELPELKRVIVASGDGIAMRETLEEALVALIEAEPPVTELEGAVVDEAASEEASDEVAPEATAGPADVETPVMEESIQALIERAGEHYAAAEEAQRAGDWTTYGRELEALGAVLRQLEGLTGGG